MQRSQLVIAVSDAVIKSGNKGLQPVNNRMLFLEKKII